MLTSVILNFISVDPVGSTAIPAGNCRSKYIKKGTHKFAELFHTLAPVSDRRFWKAVCAFTVQSATDLQNLKVLLRQCCIYLSFIYLFTCFFKIYSSTPLVSQNMLRRIVP